MNIKKFEKRLNKINMLFNSIKEETEVSQIEKDLLLSYLRDAYSYALEKQTTSANKATNSYKEPEYHMPPSLEQISPKKTHAPSPTPVVERIVAEEVQSIEPDVVVTAHVKATDAGELNLPEELISIFEKGTIEDLSDKLSMSPIKDMTKSMGINERIFTVKELFGGDTVIFNSVLDKLNGFNDYQEARTYLMTGIARDQDWTSDIKVKKAIKFIKLVKRRYV